MNLPRQTLQEGVLTLGIQDEQVAVRRVDRYAQCGWWPWYAAEEVEIWALPDGRQVRVIRKGSWEWQYTW